MTARRGDRDAIVVELAVLGVRHAGAELEAAVAGLAEKARRAIHETLGDPFAFAAARVVAVELASEDAAGRLAQALLEATERVDA